MSASIGVGRPSVLQTPRSNPLAGVFRVVPRLDVPIAAALLALVSFSLPGREGPESAAGLDPIAIAKFGIRGMVACWFGFLWLSRIVRGVRSTEFEVSSGTYWGASLLLPWLAFVAWCMLSILWSPLKTVSAGQWLGLVALMLLSETVAVRYDFRRRSDPSEESKLSWQLLVNQLMVILTLYSSMVLVMHVLWPDGSGLDRSISMQGNNGFIHPTAAGATASLGFVLGLILLLRNLTSSRTAIGGAMLLHAVLLLLSSSRSALAVTCLTATLCLVALVGMRTRGLLLTLAGCASILYLLIDPGFEIVFQALEGTSEYVRRGQSAEQLRGVSGRMEMWEAIWEQSCKSPLIGHGYFVTSSTGKLDVWDGPANHDAHNVGLQVLVTTGCIGCGLFALAVLRSVVALVPKPHPWRSTPDAQTHNDPTGNSDFWWLVLIMGVWFLVWGQACVSFLGPIRPESVLFFVLLGLMAAEYASRKDCTIRSESSQA